MYPTTVGFLVLPVSAVLHPVVGRNATDATSSAARLSLRAQCLVGNMTTALGSPVPRCKVNWNSPNA